jgi:WhiB family redox-sensing transcriptional regulator
MTARDRRRVVVLAAPAPDPESAALTDLDSAVPVGADWEESALCRQVDPEMFFPESGEDPVAAKEVCRRCSVRLLCLQTALVRRERFGVWGGLSAVERRRLLHDLDLDDDSDDVEVA